MPFLDFKTYGFLKRLLFLLTSYFVVIFVLISLSYVVVANLPGDYYISMYENTSTGFSAGNADIQSFFQREVGYFGYLYDIVTFNWGYSFLYAKPVLQIIGEVLPRSLLLVVSAGFLSLVFGLFLGIETAVRKSHPIEKISVFFNSAVDGVPEFVVGLLFLIIFSTGYTPPSLSVAEDYSFFTIAGYMILPVVSVAVANIPGMFLIARNSVITDMVHPCILTAKGKGLTDFYIKYKHLLIMALPPVLSRFGIRFGFILTGALVVENIFSFPGLGTLFFEAIQMRDVNLIRGIFLVSALFIILMNMLADTVIHIIYPFYNEKRDINDVL